MRFSGWKVFCEGLRHNSGWQPLWRSPEPKARYDVLIIGGGGHGLATAYYLAKNHNVRNIAILEKGWLGGGNTGRNTTIVRSNYYYPQSAALYDHSLKLYEGLSRALNFNIMLSQRGVINIAHSRHDLESCEKLAGAMHLNGIDADVLDTGQVARRIPVLNVSPSARYPVWGGLLQTRGGTARHDAVAWGYARAADALGVDIIQTCEVKALEFGANGRVIGVETSRGSIRADKVAMTAAGHSGTIAAMAGFRLPITSYALQAFVSEPVKPVINTVALSLATGVYLSQSDKGGLVAGSGLDLYPSYAQRGNFPIIERTMNSIAELYPSFGRVRLLRQWAGIVDVTPDSSPIIGETPAAGLYLNCGWGTGGFKAIPAGGWTLAHHLATSKAHPLAAPFGLDRFARGALIDEAAGAGIPH